VDPRSTHEIKAASRAATFSFPRQKECLDLDNLIRLTHLQRRAVGRSTYRPLLPSIEGKNRLCTQADKELSFDPSCEADRVRRTCWLHAVACNAELQHCVIEPLYVRGALLDALFARQVSSTLQLTEAGFQIVNSNNAVCEDLIELSSVTA
jgi:hypothetical protein